MQLTFRIARTSYELIDHLLWEARHWSLPTFGEEIDIEALGCGNCVDFYLARQCDADCAAVGVATRSTYVVRSVDIEPLDSQRHGLIEGDDDDLAGDSRVSFNCLVELKHQPQMAAICNCFNLALNQIVGAHDIDRCECEQGNRREDTCCLCASCRSRPQSKPHQFARKCQRQPEWQSRHKAVPPGENTGRNSVRRGV